MGARELHPWREPAPSPTTRTRSVPPRFSVVALVERPGRGLVLASVSPVRSATTYAESDSVIWRFWLSVSYSVPLLMEA